MNILNAIGELIKTWFNTFGYGGIVLAMALESCLIPLPSEIIMPVAGAFVAGAAGSTVHFNLIGVALAGSVGSVIGSAVAYWIGASGGRPFVMKYGKYILISRHDFDLADRWFTRYGSGISFFSRMLPVIRTYISLPAGITRMNLPRFLIFSFLGSFPWSLALAYVGFKLGPKYDTLSKYFHGADAVIGTLIVVGLGLYLYRHFKSERAYDAKIAAGATPPRPTGPATPPVTNIPGANRPIGPRQFDPNGPDAPTTKTPRIR